MDDLQVNVNHEEVESIKLSFFQSILGVVLSPAETMRHLIEKPKILFPILSMIFAVPILYLSRFQLYKDLMDAVMEASLAEQATKLSAEQIEAARSFSQYTPIIGFVTAPIGQLVAWLALSGVIFAFIKAFKGEGGFKQILTVTGYAYVIPLLSIVITIIVSFISGSLNFDSSVTNFTGLLGLDIKGTYLYGIIRGIDFFKIWQYAVIGIGIAELSKLSRVKVYTALSLAFVVTLLMGAGNLKFL